MMKTINFNRLQISIGGVHAVPMLFSFFFLLYVLPIIVNGENSYITIHDNLDGLVANRVVLARSGFLVNVSGSDVVMQIMGGLPRNYIASGLNLSFLFFSVFPPFTAYLINHIFVHLVAFLGMALFLHRYLSPLDGIDETMKAFMIWGSALAFGVLPFYPMYGLTIAGQPLLLYAFLNIINRKDTITDILIIFLFPFYANFLLIGIFIVAMLCLFFLIRWIRNRVFNQKEFFVLCIFSLLFIMTEYDFLRANLFDPQYVSHRSDWNLAFLSFSLPGVGKNILDMFLHGQYHAPSHHEWILGIAVVTVLLFFLKGRRSRISILGLITVQFLIAVLYGFYFWDSLIPFKEKFGLLSSFNLGRVHWFSPFLWYWILFSALVQIRNIFQNKALLQWGLIGMVIFVQLFINLSYNSDYGHYVSKVITLPGFTNEGITYREFYSENLFSNIKKYIEMPQEEYRTISIGIHPAIAQYNGFYTLDGYQSNYPLSYKKQFRQVIAPELAKSPRFQSYFDYWGSRCYIFSSEVSHFLVTKEHNQVIQSLDLDMNALKALGGRYIFSALEIKNYLEENLNLLGVFEDPDSVWKIYLYQVN